MHAPTVTRALVELFTARHDPAFRGDRAKGEAHAQGQIRTGLSQISAINDDRLLRHPVFQGQAWLLQIELRKQGAAQAA